MAQTGGKAKVAGLEDLIRAREHYESGSFSRLYELSSRIIPETEANNGFFREIDYLVDMARRLTVEFPWSAGDIIRLLEDNGVEAGYDNLSTWEESGELEFRIINREKRYFRNAHLNLIRVNSRLRERLKPDHQRNESLARICRKEFAKIDKASQAEGMGVPVNPRMFRVRYTITVNADAVPPGEVIRCWMPFPREDSPGQDLVKLLIASPEIYSLSPVSAPHRALYFERTTRKGEPTVFYAEFEFRSWSLMFDRHKLLSAGKFTVDGRYAEYMQEDPPHITFSPQLRSLADRLAGGADGPFRAAQAFYHWIDRNIPWISAVEYALIKDIPACVLNNRRGDCGMQTLLFMSMCRYAGIPARWESGWMLHPGHVNLHDWCVIYIEPFGWIPVDVSFKLQRSKKLRYREFYISGLDSYRLTINNGHCREMAPRKNCLRSEPVDFQRGELEWRGGNIYFDMWDYHMEVKYL